MSSAAAGEGAPVLCVIGARDLSRLDPEAYLIEPIGDDLAITIGFYVDYEVVFADRATLGTRGFAVPAIWNVARANTTAYAGIIPSARELREDGEFCFESDPLTASMLADLDAWAALEAEVGPDLYVVPIADTFVWLGLCADGLALEEIRNGARSDYLAMVEQDDPEARPISPEIYRFRDGQWKRASA